MVDTLPELETAETPTVNDIYTTVTYPWIRTEFRTELQKLIPQRSKSGDLLPVHAKLVDLFGDFVQQMYVFVQQGNQVMEMLNKRLYNDILSKTNGKSVVNCVKGKERQVEEHIIGALGILTFKHIMDLAGLDYLGMREILPDRPEYDVVHKADLIIKTGEIEDGKDVYGIVQLKTDASASGIYIIRLDPNLPLNKQGVDSKKYKINDGDLGKMSQLIPRLEQKGNRPNATYRLFSVVVPQYGGNMKMDIFGRILSGSESVAERFKYDAKRAGFLP